MDDKKNQNQNADVVEEVDLEDMEQVSGGGALRDKTANRFAWNAVPAA